MILGDCGGVHLFVALSHRMEFVGGARQRLSVVWACSCGEFFEVVREKWSEEARVEVE